MDRLFFAYPANPSEIGEVIEAAIKICNSSGDYVLSWTAMDIIGDFIPERILDSIAKRTFVADVTRLNPNVAYEVGYAIGQKKFILLTYNTSIDDASPTIQEVGVFDTLGFKTYQNSTELASILQSNKSNQPYKGFDKANLHAPIYLMDTQFKTDYSTRIINRINVSRLYYRSFDPTESPRLSAYQAIKHVSESYGVLVQLLEKSSKTSAVHNIRASFIAGLAKGMGVPCRILQHGFDPIPIDYRDIVHVYRKTEDINDIIAEFVIDVVQEMQDIEPVTQRKRSYLEKLDFGASAAENEMRRLSHYYLATDGFSKAIRGEVQLVIGRKGTGKTAVFYQITSKEKSSSKNILLDLQPESYKLLKFKEQVLDYLEEGTFQHTIMAFWEYLLLLEVAHKILENDKSRHFTSDKLRDPYIELDRAYRAEEHLSQGDFSERMSFLLDRLQARFSEKYEGKEIVRLSNPEVTGLIHETNIKVLKEALIKYLKYKDRIWILFDNIDKGWPASGITRTDLLIIRSLIDASKNLQRFFERSRVNLFPIIFLRSDVYHQLVLETSDRQKESKVSLDWTDRDLLRRLVELRIIANDESDEELDFNARWRNIAISHFKGEDSFQFIMDRSLMRPRFLINFLNHCKSFAVNLNHEKIQEDDITKGLQAYSADVLEDIELEIRDVFPEHTNILTAFYNSSVQLSGNDVQLRLSRQITESIDLDKIIDILLLYGFLGILVSEGEVKYVFDVNYNISLLKAIQRNLQEHVVYYINPAFWSSLHVV